MVARTQRGTWWFFVLLIVLLVALWYGVIFMINMQMAFLSPPFGYSLFYLKSVAPPEVTMATIFRAAVPFMGLQALGLFLCITFPEIILWLPKVVYGGN